MERMGHLIRQMTPLNTPGDFQFRVYSGIRREEMQRRRNPFFGWRTVVIPVTAMVFGIFIGLYSDVFFSGDAPVPILMARQGETSETTEIAPEDLYAALMASGTADGSLVFDSDNTGIVRDYNLDRYVHHPMIPVTVDTIPDDENPEANLSRTNPSGKFVPSRQYVLDNVPMRVGYERIVY